MSEGDPTGPPSLRRVLGNVEATALVVGGTIGTSIFVIPSAVAANTGTPVLALATWCIAGLLAFAAGLCLAELSSAIPETGGTYAFLRRAFRSRLVPFSFAWMISFVYGPGAMAVVAIMSATFAAPYVAAALQLDHEPIREIALILLASVFVVNVLGVRVGGLVQSVLTLSKVILLVALIVIAFAFLESDFSILAQPVEQSISTFTWSGLTSALLLCVFSFSGAHFVTLVAGEVRSPGTTIPRAIITGMLIVTVLYLLFNFSILSTLPFATVTSSQRIAIDLMDAALGPMGAAFAAATVFTSGVAVLNAQCLGYPRVLYSLAKDGFFLDPIGKVQATTKAPAAAIAVCIACAAIYLFSGTYTDVLGYMSFVIQLSTTLMVLSVVLLRLREPDLVRPYRVWGYPWTPIVFIAASTTYLVALVVTKTSTVLVGILVVAAGFPFYLAFRARARRQEAVADH